MTIICLDSFIIFLQMHGTIIQKEHMFSRNVCYTPLAPEVLSVGWSSGWRCCCQVLNCCEAAAQKSYRRPDHCWVQPTVALSHIPPFAQILLWQL